MLIRTDIGLIINPNSPLNLNKEKLKKLQEILASKCIRLMVPYTPMLNGVLLNSTVIGSGEIRYNAPYARYQYYGKLMVADNGSSYAKKYGQKHLIDKDLKYNISKKHPNAGRLWFERMKADKIIELKKTVISNLI